MRATDRVRLEAVVANRNSPQKHVWRARIILLTADGLGTNAVTREDLLKRLDADQCLIDLSNLVRPIQVEAPALA